MPKWIPEYLLKYNLSPKPTTFSHAPDPGLDVGTEHALRYLVNIHHAMVETKKQCSENQLNENHLEVNPDQNTPFLLYQEIGHQTTPPHFHMYVGPLVPTDPQIFVVHKLIAVIFLDYEHSQSTLRSINWLWSWMKCLHDRIPQLPILQTQFNISRPK